MFRELGREREGQTEGGTCVVIFILRKEHMIPAPQLYNLCSRCTIRKVISLLAGYLTTNYQLQH
jgi:hypothetical protein